MYVVRLNSKIFNSVSLKSFFVGLIILVAVAAFVFTGFGRIKLTGDIDPGTAAIVGRQKISMQEFRLALQSKKIDNLKPEQQDRIANQVLDELIKQRIIMEISENLGWEASDAEIALWIRNLSEFQDPKTKTFDYKIYKDIMSKGFISEPTLYSLGKASILQGKFQTLAQLNFIYPEDFLKELYLRDNLEYTISYALIEPSPKALDKELEKEVENYVKSESNKETLKNLFNENPSKFDEAKKYDLDSILISFKGAKRASGKALKRNKDAAIKLAHRIQKNILQKKATFKTLSKKYNDDVSTKVSNGYFGSYELSALDEASRKGIEVLSLKNPISKVVETPFGFRVYKLNKIQNAKKYEEKDVNYFNAKKKLEGNIKKTLEAKLVNELEVLLAKDDMTALDKFLKGNDIKWLKGASPVKSNMNFIPGIGNSHDIGPALLEIKKNNTPSKKVLKIGDKSVLIKVLTIKKAPEPKSSELDALSRRLEMLLTYEFMESSERGYFESLIKSNSIEKNPIIFRNRREN